MKVVLTILLVLLVVLAVVPVGTGDMADCPACTSGGASLALGLCAGIVALVALAAPRVSRRLVPVGDPNLLSVLTRSVYRPPRDL